MVNFSSATSYLRKGGLTNRGGSNTEDLFKTDSPPTTSNQKPSWWKRAAGKVADWFGNHAEGVGKVAGGVAGFGATGADAIIGLAGGTPFVSKLVSNLKKEGQGLANESSGFGKFMKGFTNNRIDQNTPGVYKALDDPLTKGTAKYSNVVDAFFANRPPDKPDKPINVSNGHIPQGYPKASVGTTVLPSSTPISTASTIKPTKFVYPSGQIGNVKPYYVPPSISGNPKRLSDAIAREWMYWKKNSKIPNIDDLSDEEKRKLFYKWLKKKKGFNKKKWSNKKSNKQKRK